MNINLPVNTNGNILCGNKKSVGLRCMYTNTDTLTNKMEELEIAIADHKYYVSGTGRNI